MSKQKKEQDDISRLFKQRVKPNGKVRKPRYASPEEREQKLAERRERAAIRKALGITGLGKPRPRSKKLTKKYREYITSKEWWNLRMAFADSKGNKCERCGGPGHHVHHKTYRNFRKETFDDLELLCRDCHEKEHKRRMKRAGYDVSKFKLSF